MSLRDWHILRQLSPDLLRTIRIAFVFGQTGNSALIVTADDKVFGVGANTSHCLGLTDTADCALPGLNSILSDKNVEGFTCGGNPPNEMFLIARLRTGDIYQWGLHPWKSANGIVPSPVRVDFGVSVLVKVKAVACGVSHCMVVSDDGRVFTWGQNDNGQLGLDGLQPNQTVNTPSQVGGAIKEKFVTEISCGAKSSLVVINDGKVFSWGSNRSGQLGINNGQDLTSPVPVAVLIPKNVIIEKIACGASHFLALSKNGQLYVGGSNVHSQLGVSNSRGFAIAYVTPVERRSTLKFVDICASYASDLSVAVCESGEIYMWGRTSTGTIINEPTNSECESIHQVFASYARPNMMPKPLRHVLTAKRRGSILKELENEFGNPENSDLTILVDDHKIFVHRAILKIRSTFFKSMLARWVGKNQKVVTIREKSFTALEAYLKYLYTDKLEVDLDLALELLQLGDEYADENFKLLCEQSIKRDMTVDKVAEVFSFTRKLETCKELNSFCFEFALKNANKVVDSEGFKKWDQNSMAAFTTAFVKISSGNHVSKK